METVNRTRRVRFGAFEADLDSGELRKQGIKIKIHDQPFQVLAMLLEHPGQVVTREQLRQKLWPPDTFVDFDVGLNSAIKRLRGFFRSLRLDPTCCRPRRICAELPVPCAHPETAGRCGDA